jgi:hypothetical protein
MKLLLASILALSACGGSGGGGGGGGSSSPHVEPTTHATFVPSSPTDLYFNQHDTIEVVITNDGQTSIYTPLSVTMDGDQMAGLMVPTLAPGESFTASYPIWAAQDATVDHAFVLSSTSMGWSYSVTIHYHGLTSG